MFGWYSSSPSLECYVQRLTSSGVELFPQAPAWSGDWAAPLAAIAKAVGSLSEDKNAGFDGLDDDFILG